MSVIDKDVDAAACCSTAELVQAFKRIAGKKCTEKVCWQSRGQRRHCRRLPRWFLVWFVIAMALLRRDAYWQVFRWLNHFQPRGAPCRPTLCEASKSVGVGLLRRWAVEWSRCASSMRTSQRTPSASGVFQYIM